MTTKVIFNIDKKVKERAQKKARQQGLTLSSVLNLAANAYANNRLEVDVLGEIISQARREIREGKGIPATEVYKRLGIKIK
jgi:antitoxin component of RelBE/YafQ-DinJ toxin-antitoxin module